MDESDSMFDVTELENDAAWFRETLAMHGVRPRPDAPILRMLDNMGAVGRGAKASFSRLNNEEMMEAVRDGMSMVPLVAAFRSTSQQAQEAIAARLRLLERREVGFLQSGSSNQDRDQTWELLVAALAGSFASDVRFDEKPDVLISHGETCWGLACKSPNSLNPDTQKEAIVEGVKQIESAPCDLGIVMLNLTNLVPHHEFLRAVDSGKLRAFRTAENAHHKLSRELLPTTMLFADDKFLRRLSQDKFGAPRNKTRAVVAMAMTVAIVQTRTWFIPFWAHWTKPGGPRGEAVVMNRLRDALTSALMRRTSAGLSEARR